MADRSNDNSITTNPSASKSAPLLDNTASERSILRFLTCGSVDDGKSTLIGRLLYDCQLIHDDTLATIENDSKTFGTTGDTIDFALLVDGLQAEREQGITIDVAYRYFATPERKFIVADTPGHEQYTRNMVTGASTCDLAVILVDARKGLLAQTLRHTCIVHLLGIKHVVLAINKMDLVDYQAETFHTITAAYEKVAQTLELKNVTAIPLSAREGDNLIEPSKNMPWYNGTTLLHHLETVDTTTAKTNNPFRMPIQWVCRPNLDFRGYAGTLASGSVKPGDSVIVLPSSRTTSVARIVTKDGDLPNAESGDAVVLTLTDEVDVSRGDVLCHTNERAEVADQVRANLVWMSQKPLLKGRPYILRAGTQSVIAQISDLKYKLNVESLEHVASRELECNEIGVCDISTSKPIVLDAYKDNRQMGGFILIDRATNETVGVGMIEYALRRAHNIHWQALNITRDQRAKLKAQKACCLWFTGLSGSGKSTIANDLEKRLFSLGHHTYILDGDNVRHGLNRDLGFTDADRVENIRRVAEVARLMTESGLITIAAFISPFRAERQFARERFEQGEFLEVFVDTPLEVCEQRDAKGLYKKAREGKIANFTGISSPYETPQSPELTLDGANQSQEDLVDQIISELTRRGFLSI